MSDVPLYNPNDGLFGRGSSAGGYLDENQAVEAEIRRAKIEGREPDLDNPGAYAGIQLQTAAQLIANRALEVNRVGETGFARPGEDVFKQSVDNPDTPLRVMDKIPATAFDENGLGAPEPGSDEVQEGKDEVHGVPVPVSVPEGQADGDAKDPEVGPKANDADPKNDPTLFGDDDVFASDKDVNVSNTKSGSDAPTTSSKTTSRKSSK